MRVLLISILFFASVFSQDKKIEQIYLTICDRAGINVDKPLNFKPFDSGKCGFGLYVEALKNWDKFDLIQKTNIQKSLERPALQTSIVTPSGKFRIHFDTTGVNTPFLIDEFGNRIPNSWRMYVDSIAKYIDSVYNVEVNYLGFEFNFNDDTLGGGNEYDIYIQNLSEGLYGETVFDPLNPLPRTGNAQRFLSYMRIDNSYSESSYYTQGINALKVTLAHEFGHAIQLLSYGLWEQDLWFYEMTSTWLEEFVFDDVNDYYAYIPRFFKYTSTPIYQHDGYDLVVFGIFLQERFTHKLIVNAWEFIKNYPPLSSLELALNKFNSSLKYEFVEFALWNLYTGKRAKYGYYKEAMNYPEIRFETQPIAITSNEAFIRNSAGALSTQYYMFIWRSDTIIAIISNVNLSYAFNRSVDEFNFEYHITTGAYADYTPIGNGLKSKLNVPDFDNWGNLNILNSQVAIVKNDNVFPNPFYADGFEKLLIPVESAFQEVELKIFTAGLDLVYSAKVKPEFNFGNYFVSWNGRNNSGEIAKSGVYIYFVSAGGKEKLGKFVLIRK
ncbi:MXAN_6640 family putative metalloprotease [Candidatus Chrysopegis kryptomonas]|uniref:FlgD Ig-like domain-containing protein n=1 Tax=Candidatus Chryseopegocella kryptomonas TaxID=1633643 RepID=A0A0P1MMY8_9BACT|nr:MXAN_6640 family putative metalloprotease [Candidatus Chrysopegis kryptomonas]CUS97054.1 hypothetical protein JGI23_00230 [Candidatus Chrysopegis kryptomonas]